MLIRMKTEVCESSMRNAPQRTKEARTDLCPEGLPVYDSTQGQQLRSAEARISRRWMCVPCPKETTVHSSVGGRGEERRGRDIEAEEEKRICLTCSATYPIIYARTTSWLARKVSPTFLLRTKTIRGVSYSKRNEDTCSVNFCPMEKGGLGAFWLLQVPNLGVEACLHKGVVVCPPLLCCTLASFPGREWRVCLLLTGCSSSLDISLDGLGGGDGMWVCVGNE